MPQPPHFPLQPQNHAFRPRKHDVEIDARAMPVLHHRQMHRLWESVGCGEADDRDTARGVIAGEFGEVGVDAGGVEGVEGGLGQGQGRGDAVLAGWCWRGGGGWCGVADLGGICVAGLSWGRSVVEFWGGRGGEVSRGGGGGLFVHVGVLGEEAVMWTIASSH